MHGKPTGFWAKLERDEQDTVTEWHPLRAHSADVAACVEALLERTILGDRLASLVDWEALDSGHVARLSALAALHDAGKANRGFQARSASSPDHWAGHVSEIISAIGRHPELLEALGIETMLGWFESKHQQYGIIDILCATWAHHGRPVSTRDATFDERLWQSDGDHDPTDGLRQLATAVRDWFPEAFETDLEPFPDVPAFRHAYNGVLNLADWLGSNRRFFDFADSDEGRMPFARERAAELLCQMHLDPEDARRVLGDEPASFQTIAGLGPDQEPYDIQQKCFDLPIDPSGNLTILESDTGSGKTEAAIARFVRLFQAGEVDGLYFAVPTRSAAKQLQNRVRKALERLFPDDDHRPPTVLAVPGYVRIDELDGDPNALPGYEVQWPDERPDIAERGWAAESSKRYLAGAVAVGTVDQVLLSALQINHAHLRAAALHRHFLVVDEIHSSEPYMRRILQKVLDHHLDAGGHAMLMSATLGTADRVTYTADRHADPPPLEEAVDEDYPLLTHVGAECRNPETFHEESSDYEKEVEIEVTPNASAPAAVARRAAEHASQGARVLVIRNVVSDCLATQMALEEIADDNPEILFGPDGGAAPHHSRFAAGDRRELDRAIEHYFGKEADGGSIAAVATQTVEQSLDIDADVMLTDLCPADVLLQRIGRLHRHPNRERPGGFETARVEVLVPEDRDLAAGIVESGDGAGSGLAGDHGLGTVYRDLRVLEATWRELEETDTPWVIPRDNRRLVESTTHPERLESLVEELGGKWQTHQTHVLGERLGEGSHSELVTIDRDDHFKDNGFLTDIEGIKTRLGTDDWTVTFDPPPPGPFGESVETLSIPDYWLHATNELDEDDLTACAVEQSDDRFDFEVAGHRFIYDRLGLRPDDTEEDTDE